MKHRAHRKQKHAPEPGVTNECGLVAYRTRSAARHALRRNLRGKPLRERRCDGCGLFHHFLMDESIIRGHRTAGERFGTPLTFSASRTAGPTPTAAGAWPAHMAEILTEKCFPCDKRKYPDSAAATRAADYFTTVYGKAYRVYEQKSCGCFHVTTVLTKAERRAKKAAQHSVALAA
ncbi:hypothetical protein OOJ91_34310 [Micromonospora lupini]|uniref:hypothetical protein n=1 Tax=Micromonospora lupini TaxID=285679 RepID=UPI00225656D7|nr:hypothetical protein [Micromonospora lupini]MCX5070924.1 hypothetical protein [Micromonospora lupini]